MKVDRGSVIRLSDFHYTDNIVDPESNESDNAKGGSHIILALDKDSVFQIHEPAISPCPIPSIGCITVRKVEMKRKIVVTM